MKEKAIALGAIFTGPVVWFLNLESNFALAPLACGSGGKLPIYLAASTSMLIVAGAGLSCGAMWRRQEEGVQIQPGKPQSTSRALTLSGMALNLFCLLVIVAQTIPTLIMSGCE